MSAAGGHSEAAEPARRLHSVAGEVLESLYQHRLLSTSQLQVMHTPQASLRWTQRVIAELARQGLVAWVYGRGRLRVWYLTDAGAELVEALPDRVEERRKLLDARQAAGMLQAHTLAVNEVGIAFLRAARERGDEFSPRSWQHEVAHPIGPAPGMRRGELLIADAVFSYLLADAGGAWQLDYRFVELDRGTLPSDRLSAKLARYARLYRFRPRAQHKGAEPPPAWKARYPVFPAVLVVFADQARRALARRLDLIAALCRTEPDLKRTAGVSISFCLLEDLREKGPFAAIFTDPGRPEEPVDWLGQDSERAPVGTAAAAGDG